MNMTEKAQIILTDTRQGDLPDDELRRAAGGACRRSIGRGSRRAGSEAMIMAVSSQ